MDPSAISCISTSYTPGSFSPSLILLLLSSSSLCIAMDNQMIIFSALAFIVSVGFFVFRKSNTKKVHLPPGPPCWPFFGNLLQVSRSGKPFFEYVKDLLPKYGPIFTLKMGTRTMIIISSADLVHEALIEKSQIFASRPRENPTRIVFSCNKLTVNAALYGSVWRSLRRNMVQGMLSSSRLREFRDVRNEAMDKFVSRLRSESDGNDGLVWVLRNARFAVFCILLSMCFGFDLSEEMIETVDQLMKTVLITLDPRIDDFMPILSPLFYKEKKQAMKVREMQIQTLLPLIEKRRAIIKNPGSSYLDTLLDLEINGRKLTNPEIVSLCSEFLNGGTDTTATAIEWGVARIIENPLIQSKLYEEIKSTIGNRKIQETDIEKMTYLNAFVKELLRKHPPTYFSLTHAVTEQVKLAGYDIPTTANVEFYLPGVSEDPKLWSNPEKFDPERFLTGGEDADITGVTGVKMLPFGVGRRICPGLGMATIHVNLIVGRLVQEFQWYENSKLDFAEKSEFTIVMKNTLRARIQPRQFEA